MDLNFSNLNILLNQTSSSTISNFFEQSETIEDVIFNYSDNLDLILGDSGRIDYPRVSRELIDYLFNAINRIQYKYDFIIMDSSAGADEVVLHQLMRSDYNLIVTSPEPTAIMDSYVVLKLLIEHNSAAERYVIVNKSGDAEEGENAFMNLSTAVSHFLKEKIELLGIISLDSSAHKSIVNQDLLLNFDGTSAAADQIYHNTKRFMTIAQMANNNQAH
jgi:flagellar biosynthesis protein FlhG